MMSKNSSAHYFLGADLGATKTHAIVADQTGQVLGFGVGGPGNHQGVGYEVMFQSLNNAVQQALEAAGLSIEDISSTAMGIAGYDWPSEMKNMGPVIDQLGLRTPYRVVNDTILGLVAGARDGWGVVVVAGTGCNCRGWDKLNKREGRVTGYGILAGEFAGASELVYRAMQLVCFSWIKRVGPTALSDLMVRLSGMDTIDEFVEGFTERRIYLGAEHAPKIFELAQSGDAVAQDLVKWAADELAEMAKAVIRQLEFEKKEFDVVLLGGMYKAGPILIDPMRAAIQELAPAARLVRLEHPPVLGAVLLAMADADDEADPAVRNKLIATLEAAQKQVAAV
jgi:N-acetylglucosamine kinase-like BadF-type ATPase